MMTEIEQATAKRMAKQQKARKKGQYFDPLHVDYDALTVQYKGIELYVLNKRLLDQQNCWENLEAIKEAHWLKIMLYDMILETNDSDELKELAKDITECEFELQRLWKFTEDAKFHRFWETPKCECPKLDNNDAYPTGYYVTNLSCPLHGNKDSTSMTSDESDETLLNPLLLDDVTSDETPSDPEDSGGASFSCDFDGDFFDDFF